MKLFGFLYLYHLVMIAQTPPPLPPPTPHTIMWQVSLYADRSHSCTLTRQRFKYRNSSECLSPNWTLFANAVTISHLCWYCLTLEKGSADVSEILRFIHRSTSCFFHCVRRNRSHTSQRRYWYRCPVWRVAESWALTYWTIFILQLQVGAIPVFSRSSSQD